MPALPDDRPGTGPLDARFAPRGIAVVGATATPALGRVIAALDIVTGASVDARDAAGREGLVAAGEARGGD